MQRYDFYAKNPHKFTKFNYCEMPNTSLKIWWKLAKWPKKFGGKRQNGQKNLVETGKMAKKIWWKLFF